MPGAVAIVVSAIKAAAIYVAVRAAVAVAVQYVVGSNMARNQAKLQADSYAADLRAQQLANLRDVQEVVRSAVAPINTIYGRAKVGGVLTCWFTTGDVGQYHHWAQAFAYHQVDGVDAWFVNDEQVTVDGNGWVTTAKYCRGGTTPLIRVRLYDGTQTTLDADLLAASNGGFKATDAGTGCAHVVVFFEADYDVFGQTGAPKITCVVRGKPLYDPRTATTAFTDNAALATRDFLLADAGLRCSSSEVSEADIIAAANVCDESVTLTTGTQARYTVNGVLRADTNLKTNLTNLVDAMAGSGVWSQGMWRVRAGAYETPTATIGVDDIIEVEDLIAYTPRRELFNTVTGTFIDPDNLYTEKQFPVVTNASYVEQDGGQTIERQLVLPLCDNAIRAQRMAKIEIERTRQAVTVTLLCKWTVYDLTPGDHVAVTIPRYGWDGKVFFVGGRTVSPEEGIRYVLRETAAAVWAWNSGEATVGDPAPNTSLPDPYTVAPPGTPAVAEEKYETSGSAGVKARAIVTFVSVANYAYRQRLAWRPQGGEWRTLPDQVEARFVFDDIAPGTYEFRAATINTMGVVSGWSATTIKEVLGLSDLPAAVTGFSVLKSSGFGFAEWALHADLDVRIGGRIVIRHSPLTSGAAWENGIIVQEFNGDAVTGSLPLMTGTYMAKARDSSGKWSTTAASFVATDGMVTGFTTVDSSVQHAAFSGSKSNVAVLDGTLRLSGLSTISDMATPVSEWGKISSLGGISSAGSYDFDAVLDLTSIATRRFEADIAATSFDTGDTIGQRGLVSGWGSVASESINDCDATLYISTTDDDPDGSPTWGPWTPFFVGDFTCRAARMKLDLASGQANHNIRISTLRVDVKEPV
jgi:hypothetical protein